MYPYVKLQAPSLHRYAGSGHRNGAPERASAPPPRGSLRLDSRSRDHSLPDLLVGHDRGAQFGTGAGVRQAAA